MPPDTIELRPDSLYEETQLESFLRGAYRLFAAAGRAGRVPSFEPPTPEGNPCGTLFFEGRDVVAWLKSFPRQAPAVVGPAPSNEAPAPPNVLVAKDGGSGPKPKGR